VTGRDAEAVEAGLAAVAADPLRESAQRVLIRVYRCEGNVGEPSASVTALQRLCGVELGMEPSFHIEAVFAGRRTTA
jgi:DNA-binding SARP family transcriptional activator